MDQKIIDNDSFAKVDPSLSGQPNNSGLGAKLRQTRKEQGLTLHDIAHELKIPEKSLQALENDDYGKLPVEVYARGFVKIYSEYLGLDSSETVAEFSQQYAHGKSSVEQKITPQQLRQFRHPLFVLTPRLTAISVGIVVALIALLYLFFEVRGFTRAPHLDISSPVDNSEIKSNNVMIKGKSDTTAEVKINGEKTFVRSDGTFEETIGVGPGLNKIVVVAKGISGKERTVTREVLVQQNEPVPPSASPTPSPSSTPAIIGESELKMRVTEPVWVSIIQDGKNVYAGLFTPEGEKTFKGKEIRVTAGKANKVEVKTLAQDWHVLGETPGVVKDVVFKEGKKAQ